MRDWFLGLLCGLLAAYSFNEVGDLVRTNYERERARVPIPCYTQPAYRRLPSLDMPPLPPVIEEESHRLPKRIPMNGEGTWSWKVEEENGTVRILIQLDDNIPSA